MTMTRFSLRAVSAAIVMTAIASNAAIVYDNTTTSLNRVNLGNSEVGDQIILAGTERQAQSFAFQFFTSAALSGGEQARLRFYANTGVNGAPSTLLYDSGLFGLGTPQANGATFNFTAADFASGATPLTINLPNSFTWTVQFTGIDAGEQAGLYNFGPPAIGNSYTDYWFKNGADWELRTIGSGVDFAAQLTAVPEPSVVSLGLLGLLGFAGMAWKRNRR